MRFTRRLADALRSPARLVAFMRRVSEIAWRGELRQVVRRIRPRGPTPAEYHDWLGGRHASVPAQSSFASIVALDAEDSSARQALSDGFTSLPSGAVAVVVRDPDGGWRTLNGAASRPLSAWLDEAQASWIWWIAAPLQLAPEAPGAFARAVAIRGAKIVYADHDAVDAAGPLAHPVLKPAWDAEQIIERPYAGPLLVVHADLAGALDDARDGGTVAQWRVLLDAARRLSPEAIVHVPLVAAHVVANSGQATTLRDRSAIAPAIAQFAASRGEAIDIDVSRTPWLRFAVPADRPLSVVIPTRDRFALLKRCLTAVMTDEWPSDGEVVVVDNGSSDPRIAKLLQAIKRQARLIEVPLSVPFNFPRLCNAGVAAAQGRVVVLLNNDTVAKPGWLSELTSLAIRRHVGAVGPLLAYPDGVLQSAGVLLGVNRTATSALAGFRADDPVARAWCTTRRRVSAVLGACLAIEREKYLRVGGMDERFAVSHNELDLCLRLEANGLSNLFTPFACVVHEEGATRGFEVTAAERQRLDAEEAAFRARWGRVIDSVDPAHHPALSRAGNPFALTAGQYEAIPRAGWRSGSAYGSSGEAKPDG